MEKLSFAFKHPLFHIAIILGITFVVYLAFARRIDQVTMKARLPRRLLLFFIRLLMGGVGLLAVAGVLDIDLSDFFSGIAALLATIAIGFVALWSVLSNLLCTMILVIFKPFAIGDDIRFVEWEVEGVVVDIDLVYTTLSSKEGEKVRVPNNLFFQKVIKIKPGHDVRPLEDHLETTKFTSEDNKQG